jgi:hypothetical protein
LVLADTKPDAGAPLSGGAVGLFWTDPLDGVTTFLADAVAAWTDDISGLLNMIVVDGYTDGNQPTGLAVMGKHLAIFGTRSIHVVRGTGPSDWQIRKEIDNLGCVDARSIVSADDGVYFASETGYWFYDGASLEELSRNVHSKFSQIRLGSIDTVSATLIDHDHIMVSLAQTNGTGVDVWTGLLHIPSRSWAEFSSAAMPEGAPKLVAGVAGDSALVDGLRIWSLQEVTAPTNTIFDVQDLTGEAWIIPAQWTTKMASLAQPELSAVIQAVRSGAILNASTGDSTTSWTYFLKFPTGQTVSTLGTNLVVPEVVDTRVQRLLGEANSAETNEAALTASLHGPVGVPSGSVSLTGVAELQEHYLYYQPTRTSGPY